MYRLVKDDEDEALNSFIRLDYDKSIQLRYNLDHTQVEYAKANSEIFRHMEVIYTDIVKPMELALKRLAIRLNVCSEAELFASNLQYRVFQREKDAPD